MGSGGLLDHHSRRDPPFRREQDQPLRREEAVAGHVEELEDVPGHLGAGARLFRREPSSPGSRARVRSGMLPHRGENEIRRPPVRRHESFGGDREPFRTAEAPCLRQELIADWLERGWLCAPANRLHRRGRSLRRGGRAGVGCSARGVRVCSACVCVCVVRA